MSCGLEGGTYTSNFFDFVSIDACLLALSNIPINPGEPLYYFPAMQPLLHQNTPFKVSLQSARKDMLFINRYNNHRASNSYLSSIHENSATGIQKSYSILLPLWTLRFFSGLFIDTLRYAIRKHKIQGVFWCNNGCIAGK